MVKLSNIENILSENSPSLLIKFGVRVYNLLVENFPQTFYVGGMVRDLLIGKKVTDIDIATAGVPKLVVRCLGNGGVRLDENFKNFGIIKADWDSQEIEIATFRKDIYSKNRYPKVSFTDDVQIDSERRDFTVNSLYLSGKDGKILDYHEGLSDLKKKLIRFIGEPGQRIMEDPLRILRAMRFALDLNFKLEKNTLASVKNFLPMLEKLTASRIQLEVARSKNQETRKILEAVKDKPQTFDKYFF